MNLKAIILWIICGVALALLSALYSQDMTVGLGATITGYGLPLLWLEKVVVVYPGNPTTYSLYGSGAYLLADIIFWIVIVAIIYMAYMYIKK